MHMPGKIPLPFIGIGRVCAEIKNSICPGSVRKYFRESGGQKLLCRLSVLEGHIRNSI